MPSYFGVTIRFLDLAFHGRQDGGDAEWPPSPLRVFQALVAAAARRSGPSLSEGDAAALRWLETLPPPTVIAPRAQVAQPIRSAVPNNDLDVVAAAWSRGLLPAKQPNALKTMKTIRPNWLLDGDTVRFVWMLSASAFQAARPHIDSVASAARSVVALGWGIDMVVGDAATLSSEEVDALPGERWIPTGDTRARGLRVAVPGSLEDLALRHGCFLARLDSGGFTPSPPLSTFAMVGYRRVTDPQPRSLAAFSLLKLDASGFRPFDTAGRALTLAGMMRHLVKNAAMHAGWDELRINAFVLGHAESNNGGPHVAVGPNRFAYLPLPSIEARGIGKSRVVGSIRRVLLAASSGCEEQIAWARRALPGQQLVRQDDHEPSALLALLPETDRAVRLYTQAASTWTTVTPVVLPGYDDPSHYRRRLRDGVKAEEQKRLLEHLHDRVDGLLRKAIVQAGFSDTLAKHVELEWRSSGFCPGADLADRYGVPDHLRRFPRLHVRLCWRDPQGRELEVPGPVCIGGGRYAGLGLFVAGPAVFG